MIGLLNTNYELGSGIAPDKYAPAKKFYDDYTKKFGHSIEYENERFQIGWPRSGVRIFATSIDQTRVIMPHLDRSFPQGLFRRG